MRKREQKAQGTQSGPRSDPGAFHSQEVKGKRRGQPRAREAAAVCLGEGPSLTLTRAWWWPELCPLQVQRLRSWPPVPQKVPVLGDRPLEK